MFLAPASCRRKQGRTRVAPGGCARRTRGEGGQRMSTPGRECCSGRRLRTAGAGGGASPAGHGMERRRGAGVFRELGAYTTPAMPAVAAMRGAQHLVAVATSASSSVAAARCKRARLPDAHEEVVGNPERGGAPSSRGGRRSQSVDGVCDTDWEDGISNTVHPWPPTVHPMRRGRPRFGASQVASFSSGARGSWPR